MPTRCGVIGSPVGHSLSPALHRAAYDALGLDWEYDAYDVTEHALPAFLAGLGPGWRGLSVTMPLKRSVIAHCAALEPAARQVEAVNTLLIASDHTMAGYNTDITGFVAVWREFGLVEIRRAAVVGAGATARSAIAALASVGARSVTVVARAPERTSAVVSLAADLGLECVILPLSRVAELTAVDLVVSTIPAAAQAAVAGALVEAAAAVTEVVYEPHVTPLLVAASRAGRPGTTGFDLLLHQAARQVELMTGRSPAPLEAMRQAGAAGTAPAPVRGNPAASDGVLRP